MISISWNQRKNKSRIEPQEGTDTATWLQDNVISHKFPAIITIGALCTCEVREVPPELEPFVVIGSSSNPVKGIDRRVLLNLPGTRIEGNPEGSKIKVNDTAPFHLDAKSRVPTIILSFSEVFLFNPTFMPNPDIIEESLLKYFIH